MPRKLAPLLLLMVGCATAVVSTPPDHGDGGTPPGDGGTLPDDGTATIAAPAPSATTGGTCRADVTLSWSEVHGASYTVEWGLQGKPPTSVDVPAGTTSTTLTNVGPGDYSWHVRATIGGAMSDWSPGVSFTVAAGTPGSFAQQPADFLGNTNTTVAIVATGVTLGGTLDSGNGADGAFNATANTTIAGGAHNFRSFAIAAGVVVTVTGTQALLVKSQNTVDIQGTLDASGPAGGNGVVYGTFGSGGVAIAGGSNGGDGVYAGSPGTGVAGQGPGGGGAGSGWQGGGGGGYANVGGTSAATSMGSGIAGGPAYGTADLAQLLGGSGGGGGSGGNGCGSGGGGAGGGVIQIAAGASITIGASGKVLANGGKGGSDGAGNCGGGGGGSGGAIWLSAPTISNAGSLLAQGGAGGTSAVATTGGTGSVGRIRTDGAVSGGGSADPPAGYSGSVSYVSTGATVTPAIAPGGLCGWGMLTFDADTTPPGTTVTVDVFDAQGQVLATSVASGTDLSTVPAVGAAAAIKLRGNLATTDTAKTPTLKRWSVAYTSK